MPDMTHWFGEDLQIAANGDVLMSKGIEQSNERIVRRLMTNQGSYVWHPTYGASMPERIGGLNGALPNEDAHALLSISAVVRTQIELEPAAAKDPEPDVTLTPLELNDGVFVQVRYTDGLSGDAATLAFDVEI